MNRHAAAGHDETTSRSHRELVEEIAQLGERERVLISENDQLRAQLVEMKEQEKKKYDDLMVQYNMKREYEDDGTAANQVTVKTESDDEDVKVEIKEENDEDDHNTIIKREYVTEYIKTESDDVKVEIKEEIKEEDDEDDRGGCDLRLVKKEVVSDEDVAMIKSGEIVLNAPVSPQANQHLSTDQITCPPTPSAHPITTKPLIKRECLDTNEARNAQAPIDEFDDVKEEYDDDNDDHEDEGEYMSDCDEECEDCAKGICQSNQSQNVMDSAPKGNEQIEDCVKREIKEEEEDGQMMNIKEEVEVGDANEVDNANEGDEADEVNGMNNPNGHTATDIDTLFDRSMRDEEELAEPTRANLELMPILNEAQSNLTNREEENDEDDLDRSEDGGVGAQVDNHLDRVESPINAQPPESIFKPRLFTELEIKTELEYGNVDELFAELGLPTGSQQQPAAVQLAANQTGGDESRRMENAPMDTTPPAHLTRQSQANIVKSARIAKRKRQVPQARNEVTNRDNLQVQGDEETGQIDEVSSRHVKRPKMDITPREEGDRMGSGQEPIGEKSATQSTTDPVQPNSAQPNRRYQCPQCHKSFDRNFLLQRHLRVHTGERPFQCDECGQRFSERSSLTRHQLAHQNIRNFQCPECDKQFTRKDLLDTHFLAHSGERPFACRHCEMSFTTSHARTKHEQAIHLHVKPYRCKQCGLTATRQSTIITHIRMVHFGLPKTIKQQRELNIVDERDPRELMEKV